LIGLAAAAIALGSDEVARYLAEIVPPVLACFTDQDARVRYYACEAMYNIAKVAKGEILLFFNEIFDALCKLAADSELSVKNGAELLDRLVKDIVSESAASYVSILNYNEKETDCDDNTVESEHSSRELPIAFSLAKFIPLLEERIHVINPFTRTFLVSWLTLLDTIPDLELVFYLPAFLGGLFKFLGDPNRDVYVATQGLLERFLDEIKKIAKIKRGLTAKKDSIRKGRQKSASVSVSPVGSVQDEANDNAIEDSHSGSAEDGPEEVLDGDWIPGQDVQVDHAKILDILLKFVDVSSSKDSAPLLKIEGLSKQKEEEIGIVALRWIDSFFEISPEEILQFVPRLLSQVLPALSAHSDQVQTTASRVNRSLMDYIVTFEDEITSEEKPVQSRSGIPIPLSRSTELPDSRRQSEANTKTSPPAAPTRTETPTEMTKAQHDLTPRSSTAPTPQPTADLDYAAAVNALTLEFLNEHEATRVAALGWLIMLHRKAPKKVLAFNDGTFPALLKTLSDPAEAVVTRDLQLLSQISKNSEDGYFTSFMVNLLQLFSTDRKLLEIRGNLIIRQLCLNLMPERIYRTLADCIEKDEDIEFASIMVQNLNNNLITAPELAELRKRLRNLETRDGQMFFVALFRAWCYNAVATFSLCLLAQAYEQAYNLLQIFAELEMTVNMLIQIDKLVQLLESPVFTCKLYSENDHEKVLIIFYRSTSSTPGA
jgi:Vacuolar protein 14 C-terminal Fig4p binding/Vacuolar 14 Fab1-binding region